MKYLGIFVWLLAIVAANLSAANFGIWATPINAFLLVGLEITLRDYLHTKLTHIQLVFMVVVGGVLSFIINKDALNIALGSSLAVTISCYVDYYIFSKSKGTWLSKSNKSNIGSAAVDSVVFPTVAFGVFNISVVLSQFAVKVFGDFIWGYLINRFVVSRK